MTLAAFDFINAISKHQNIIVDADSEKQYVPFITNRHLSLFIDAIIHANILNMLPDIDNKLQSDYYLNTLSRRSRYAKWPKCDVSNRTVEVIMQCYQISRKKATDICLLFSDDQVNELETSMQKGGIG